MCDLNARRVRAMEIWELGGGAPGGGDPVSSREVVAAHVERIEAVWRSR